MSLKCSEIITTKISLSTWKKIKFSTVRLGSSSLKPHYLTCEGHLCWIAFLKFPSHIFSLLETLWMYIRELHYLYDESNLTGNLVIFLIKKLFNSLPRRRKPRPNHQVSSTQNISQFQKRSYIFLGFWKCFTASFILEAINYEVPAWE